MLLTGLPVSDGAVVGKIYLYEPFVPTITDEELPEELCPLAIADLTRAKSSATKELEAIIAAFEAKGQKEGEIFQAHLELLDDEDVWSEILDAVNDGVNAAQAIEIVYNQYIDIMGSVDDPMMKERAADLKDVKNRLLRNLAGVPEKNLSKLPEPVVVIARDLLPADTATMDRENVLAIITQIGGRTSHSAIIARSYGIPAVLGISDILEQIAGASTIAVDGTTGQVVLDPNEDQLADFRLRHQKWQEETALNKQYLRIPCVLADGTPIDIGANLGQVSEESLGFADCVDLVGLFRTEFLYMQGASLPTEQQQFEAYSKLLKAYGHKPVVLRTLDIGGDKPLPCLPLPHEENPFLGNRALRLCLDKEALFVTQLRAALRASVHGCLWLMFPMVGTPEDFRRAKALCDRVKAELEAEGKPVADNVKYGIMIEIPSIAVLADLIVKEVDFASIGTNDLTQYTLAVDRGNPEMSSYYQMYSPAVFRLIAHVTKVFRAADKPICVCGELGGDEKAAPALIGMGMRKLSMSGSSVAAIKRILSQKTVAELETLAQQVLGCATAQEVEAYLSAK